MQMASVNGLDGVTIGRLAAASNLSKSAVQAMVGTKEDLQLVVVTAASAVYTDCVGAPAQEYPDGLPRLRAGMRAWVDDYLPHFDGGCLFLAAASEQDGHPGPVRDAIAEAVEHGEQWLRREARLAVRLHELPTDTDVDQLVFELHAIVMQTNHDLQLFQRRDTRTRAHTAISRLLGPETS